MRCLNAFFALVILYSLLELHTENISRTCPQVTVCFSIRSMFDFVFTYSEQQGLFVVTDIYPFHLHARKLNVWTSGFIVYASSLSLLL